MANLKEIAQWEDGIYQLERTDPVVGGEGGISNRQGLQLANRTAWLKQLAETLAPLDSPTFTGTPKAPTPAQTVNDTTIATTAFVKAAIAALVGSAPATLDTLAESATALGNDGKIKEVLLAEIAKKANATDFTSYLDSQVGLILLCPTAGIPTINVAGYSYISVMGQTFDKTRYPKLAKVYPSGVLPDIRGEFLRFWDNGRGVDSGRALLSAQGDAIRNITGTLGNGGSDPFGIFYQYSQTGAFVNGNDNLKYWTSEYTTTNKDRINSVKLDVSKVVPTASENRPRNIVFQAICLAA